MYDDDLNISFKKIIKWLIGLIVAAIILIPVAFVFYLNMSTPVFSYKWGGV